MVLQPAMTAIASMAAMIFKYMTASLKEARFHAAGKRDWGAAGSSDAPQVQGGGRIERASLLYGAQHRRWMRHRAKGAPQYLESRRRAALSELYLDDAFT